MKKALALLLTIIPLLFAGGCVSAWKCQTEGACSNNEGTVVSKYGHVYTGALENEMPSGHGTVIYGEGRSIHLYAHHTLHVSGGKPGDKFVGTVTVNEYGDIARQGKGVMTYKRGGSLEATWANDKVLAGPGVLTLADGRTFRGEFEQYGWICIKGDCKNGPGLKVLRNAVAIRKGQFKNGKLDGPGISGNFTALFEGTFKDGEFMSGTIKTPYARGYEKFQNDPNIKVIVLHDGTQFDFTPYLD